MNGATRRPRSRNSPSQRAVDAGSDVSTDGGYTWRRFDDHFLLGIDCIGGGGMTASLSIKN